MATAFVWNKADLNASDISGSENCSTKILHQIQSQDGIDIRSISSGMNHTLVCLQNGSVHISVHDVQQCGRKSILTNLDCIKGLPDQNVRQVAAGFSHNVVLTDAHKLYTWGQNDKGQLGREKANRKSRRKPTLVKSLTDRCILQISCGNDHTLALTNDGLVFTWGCNSYGQLGLGRSTDSNHIFPEEISCLRGIPVLQVAAGGNHSFILSKSGALYGWGRNDFGQLGLGNTENNIWPKKCRLIVDQKIKYICCGENHTACLTLDGCVLTFGAGSNFQLGHCSNENESSPKKVVGLSESEVSQIACGSNHTLAYVPNSGKLYVFGHGGSEQFELSNRENNSGPILLSDPFVLSSELHISYFSIQLANQSSELRIKSIHAGGNQSIVIVVPTSTCKSDDYRKGDPNQILSLSEDRISMLHSLSPQDTPSAELLNEIGKIFSSSSCLNGSFLLPNEEHYGCNSRKHGVNMEAVRAFFLQLAKIPNLKEIIAAKIEKNLIPVLPTSPLDIEALRLYLILPECHLFNQPEFHSSILCQFAKSFLLLYNTAMNKFDSWWPSNQPSFFKRLVVAYRQCVQYLLQLPYSTNSSEDRKRNENLIISMEMLQKLYQVNEASNIIDEITFIVPEMKDKVNITNDYLSNSLNKVNFSGVTIQGPSFSEYPFLLDSETKSILLQTDAALQQETLRINMILQGFSGRQDPDALDVNFSLPINRVNLVNDTISRLRTANVQHMKKQLVVKFEGEKAGGEGVKKEFFLLFFREVMDPKFGMFTTDKESGLQWFNSLPKQEPEIFRIIGNMCGLMIYNSAAIDLNFPIALYKKLLKKPVTLDDFKELMPMVGQGFQELLDFDEDTIEVVFGLRFEWGVTAELQPGGAERMVNQSNKNEYIDLCVDYLLNKSIEAEFNAFSEGFHGVCGGKILNSFHPEELRFLVEGNEDYDFSVLEKNTEYNGVFYRKYPTIIYFWEVFHEMSLTNKKKFLLFLTGTDRISIAGMKNVTIQIHPLDEERLPIALTCYNRLLLYRYTTKKELESALLIVIQQSTGFTLNLD